MNIHVCSGRKLVCNREGKDMGTDGNNMEGPIHSLPASIGKTQQEMKGGWWLVVTLLVGIATIFSNLYATQPILPILSQSLAVSPTLSALTVSAPVLCVALASVIYGPLSDHVGRKPVMIGAACLLLLPTSLAALAVNLPMLVICRALQGLLIPGTTVVGIAYIQEEFPPAWRGMGMGAYVSATVLGGVEGRLQGGLIADWLGWHWIFISFAITTGLGTLLMALLLPGIKHGRQVSGRTELKLRQVGCIYLQLRTFFHQRRIIGASLMALSFFFTFISIFTYIPYRMKEAPFSLSDSAVSLLYLVYLVGLFVPLWVGRLSDKVGRRIVLGCTLSGVTVGILLTALPNLIGILMGLAVLCSSLFATQTVATAFVGDNANTARGSAASFYMLWYYIGGFLGPLLCGLAWQGLGWWGVLALCLIAISVSFVSLLTLCA